MLIEIIGIVAIVLITITGLSGIVFASSNDADKQDKDVENQDEPIVEGTETIKGNNDTDIHITCTSNIPDLVSC